MSKVKSKNLQRKKRHRRVRGKVSGTAERPRLSVFRSNQHIYVQVIDDEKGETLAAASTLAATQPTKPTQHTKVEGARKIGQEIAAKAQDIGVTQIVFDRGGFKYHGRVKALAEGAREGGLRF